MAAAAVLPSVKMQQLGADILDQPGGAVHARREDVIYRERTFTVVSQTVGVPVASTPTEQRARGGHAAELATRKPAIPQANVHD